MSTVNTTVPFSTPISSCMRGHNIPAHDFYKPNQYSPALRWCPQCFAEWASQQFPVCTPGGYYE